MFLKDRVESLSDSKKLCHFLQQVLNLTEENIVVLEKFCQKFCSNINSRWAKSYRNLAQFLRRNGDWLESPINWPESILQISANILHEELIEEDDTENLPQSPPQASASSTIISIREQEDNTENLLPSTPKASTSSTIITQRKPFEELGSKQKRRRVEEIKKSLSPQEIIASATKSLKSSGNEDISKILNHLISHPEDLVKVKDSLSKSKAKDSMYSPDKALALAVSLKLTKWQYINLRESASEQGSELYPSYYKLKQAKLNCYPKESDMTITEDGASVKLQALLDLTVSRLLEAIGLDNKSKTELELISKWGFDGASGQSNYKQKSHMDFDESSVFMASLVPLRLQKHDGTIVWENDRPSSTFYCRPLMFQFTKESQSTVESIKNRITNEIGVLRSSKIEEIEVKHELHLTMIDGKITSYLSGTSSAVCDICKAKPTEMNNLALLDSKQCSEDVYQYGFSSLHAWIRCMECLLHIGNYLFNFIIHK